MPLTLDELLESTRRTFPTRFPNALEAMPRIHSLVITPFVGVKNLSVRADTSGKAEPKIYKVIIVFGGVEFGENKATGQDIEVDVGGGRKFFMGGVGNSNKVLCRCSCLDFYFTWAYWDWKEKCLYGVKPTKYIRKTTTYPERNPRHMPGLCKHLIGVVHKLRRTVYWG